MLRSLCFSLAILGYCLWQGPIAFAAEAATHVQTKTVSVKGENGTSLQTLAATPDGKVVALVSLSRYGAPATAKSVAEVRVFNEDGSEQTKWPLDFIGQSIGVGPDGAVYVAGDGQVARYSAAGKQLAKLEVPHLAEVLKDQQQLRASAEAQIKAQQESIEEAKKSFTEQAKLLREKGVDKLSDEEKQQLEALEINLKLYEQLTGRATESVERVMSQLTSRLRIINSITATDKEVFIATGELKGYGYAVWRMDLDFKNPSQVMSKLSGCCGQMDVQAAGDKLYVAENTKHRVGQFNLSGKFLTAFGKRDRESVGESFAGCCNPMNCRIMSNGDVYTAESEGIIKKFNSKGEFVALVGQAKLTGGCKNVAVAASPNGETIYFCDLPGSQIIILTKSTTPVSAQ
jgi:hypothetical protein